VEIDDDDEIGEDKVLLLKLFALLSLGAYLKIKVKLILELATAWDFGICLKNSNPISDFYREGKGAGRYDDV
jgi:hypothetical protein